MNSRKHWSRILIMVAVSLFLGMTALAVSFGFGSAFETKGTNSMREIIAGCVATGLYLAFCQFWVAPRGRGGFMAALPTMIAAVVPLLVFVKWTPRVNGIPWGLASGCMGSVIGALIAHWLTARPPRGIPPDDSFSRGRRCRNYLLGGFILMTMIVLAVSVGVIPSVVADTTRGSYAHTNGVFLGITVAFDLLAVTLLASAVWRCRAHDQPSKATLGITAFLALLLGLIYCGFGILTSGYGSTLRIASFLLLLSAASALITTVLMIVTSVIVDRGSRRPASAANSFQSCPDFEVGD